eukprot:TRINITY_DN5808_c0_g1_i1.p1 TRINITY_DN5808_c0_g1~~TRINITY_DN5808_c0_g1_i1.p1  ORF type:complete len:461 (+),score=57.46 TRINITY_DN5808_c0_g1_i1:161-1543(+)
MTRCPTEPSVSMGAQLGTTTGTERVICYKSTWKVAGGATMKKIASRELTEGLEARLTGRAKLTTTVCLMIPATRFQLLCHASVVYIPYCDGGSFTGDRTVSLQWKGNDLHFKGRRILIAALESALSRGLMNVPYILISGDSAGGLAVELNVNLINSWIQSNVPGVKRVMALSSSGFFPNVNNAAGFPQYAKLIQNVHSMNQPDLTTTNCDYLGTAEEWRCMFAQNLIPHITIPFFLQQSQVDAWVLSCIYAAYLPYNFPNETSSTNGNCSSIPNIGDCADNTELCTNAHVESINTFMENMKQTVLSTGIDKAGNGLFMHTCKSHSGLIKTEWYKHITVNGVVMDEALKEWLKNFRTDALLPWVSFIDSCKWDAVGTPRNCNPTCGDDNREKSGIDKIIHDIYHNDLDANPDLAKGVAVALFGLLFMFLVFIAILIVCCCCNSSSDDDCSSNEMVSYSESK